MVQVGYTTRCQSLWDKHNLGPAALSCVYPVETSTSLYNLYMYIDTKVCVQYNKVWYVQCKLVCMPVLLCVVYSNGGASCQVDGRRSTLSKYCDRMGVAWALWVALLQFELRL